MAHSRANTSESGSSNPVRAAVPPVQSTNRLTLTPGTRLGVYEVTALPQTYDVSLDGKRFLMIKERSGSDQTPPAIEVVQNWTEELKRLAYGSR